MGRGFIKLNDGTRDWYLEWSTVVDAPVTHGMSLDELRDLVRDEYGNEGLRSLPDRLARLDKTGTSFHNDSVDGVIAFNRAGIDETCLTKDQIIAMFCHRTGDIRGTKGGGE